MAKNYNKAKCFVKSENGFDEILYEELLLRVETDSIYKNKKFIPLHGMLMEVSQQEYKSFYCKRRRQKYLKELSANNCDISFDMLTTDEFNGEDILIDNNQDVEVQVEKQIMMDKLMKCLQLLSEKERKLIGEHYFRGISEVQLAKQYSVTQQAISKRIVKIRSKLKKLLEN